MSAWVEHFRLSSPETIADDVKSLLAVFTVPPPFAPPPPILVVTEKAKTARCPEMGAALPKATPQHAPLSPSLPLSTTAMMSSAASGRGGWNPPTCTKQGSP